MRPSNRSLFVWPTEKEGKPDVFGILLVRCLSAKGSDSCSWRVSCSFRSRSLGASAPFNQERGPHFFVRARLSVCVVFRGKGKLKGKKDLLLAFVGKSARKASP